MSVLSRILSWWPKHKTPSQEELDEMFREYMHNVKIGGNNEQTKTNK